MKRLLTSCFGLGWLGLCPGTLGSLPPAVIFALMCYFGASAVLTSIVMAALALAGSFVCIIFAPGIIAATGKNDPREIVADEFAGQAVTLMLIAAALPFKVLTTTAVAFLLFRFFDIAKPWPIRKLEKLPSGWGILADDLMAAIYAAMVLWLCTAFFLSSDSRNLSGKNNGGRVLR